MSERSPRPAAEDPSSPGLAAERTSLAHVRTALGSVVVALLVVRGTDPGLERVVIVLLATVGAATMVGSAAARARKLRDGLVSMSERSPLAILGAVVTLQLAALLAVT